MRHPWDRHTCTWDLGVSDVGGYWGGLPFLCTPGSGLSFLLCFLFKQQVAKHSDAPGQWFSTGAGAPRRPWPTPAMLGVPWAFAGEPGMRLRSSSGRMAAAREVPEGPGCRKLCGFQPHRVCGGTCRSQKPAPLESFQEEVSGGYFYKVRGDSREPGPLLRGCDQLEGCGDE